MKIEIKREQQANLQVFYWVYADDKSLKCFFAGEMTDADISKKEEEAILLAKNWKDAFVANYSVESVTVIESTEI